MKTIISMMLMFLLGAMFLSLFHMSTGMDMSTGMPDCPFMTKGEVLCPMDLVDHIVAWKTAFLALIPTIVISLLAASAVSLFLSTAPYLFFYRWKPVLILQKQIRERTLTFSYQPFRELFSSGILHPKLFV